jgi:hypothetical protein
MIEVRTDHEYGEYLARFSMTDRNINVNLAVTSQGAYGRKAVSNEDSMSLWSMLVNDTCAKVAR